MLKNIKTKLENKYYTYIPGEFMPIFRDGELDNKIEFHIYKLSRAIKRAEHRYWVLRYRWALLKRACQNA